MPNTIEVSDLEIKFEKRQILTHVSLIISEGKIHAIIGHNGSGKSTLLAFLTGLIPQGRNLVKTSEKDSIFYVPESELDYFPGFLTVKEILSVIMEAYSTNSSFQLPPSLGTHDLMNRRLSSLSHGERKRAVLALALASGAKLLILDEILEGLDIEARPLVKTICKGYTRGGKALLLTSHEAISDILGTADTISVMRNGRMLGTFSQAELISKIEYAGSRIELIGLDGIYKVLEEQAP